MMEPYRLRFWQVPSGRLATCGRPGRSKYKDAARVPDKITHEWVCNLPGPNTVIVSLLGRKPNGTSEFSFYPFYGGFDTADQQRGRPSFQEWLNEYYPDRGIEVREHPTEDFRRIPEHTLAAIARDVVQLVASGKTVVLVDSGGQTRSGAVCNYMRVTERFE
jgi:hypothetical protein